MPTTDGVNTVPLGHAMHVSNTPTLLYVPAGQAVHEWFTSVYPSVQTVFLYHDTLLPLTLDSTTSILPSPSTSAACTADTPPTAVDTVTFVQLTGLPPWLRCHDIVSSASLTDSTSTLPSLSTSVTCTEEKATGDTVMVAGATTAASQATGLPPRFLNHTIPLLTADDDSTSTRPSPSKSTANTHHARIAVVEMECAVQSIGFPPSLLYHAILLSSKLAQTTSTRPLPLTSAGYTDRMLCEMLGREKADQPTGLPPSFRNHDNSDRDPPDTTSLSPSASTSAANTVVAKERFPTGKVVQVTGLSPLLRCHLTMPPFSLAVSMSTQPSPSKSAAPTPIKLVGLTKTVCGVQVTGAPPLFWYQATTSPLTESTSILPLLSTSAVYTARALVAAPDITRSVAPCAQPNTDSAATAGSQRRKGPEAALGRAAQRAWGPACTGHATDAPTQQVVDSCWPRCGWWLMRFCTGGQAPPCTRGWCSAEW
jgi:hypothetical protein